jgi:hypothetical protein
MFRLPLSDLEVTVRPPTGQEDILLLEAHKAGPRLGVALLRRLVTPVRGECDCGTLSVMDYEALLLALHVAVFGNEIQAELSCPVKACGCRVDISFGIEEYLAHYSPCHPKGVEALPDRPGWFELGDEAVRYRLPMVEDVVAVTGRIEPVVWTGAFPKRESGESWSALWKCRHRVFPTSCKAGALAVKLLCHFFLT